MSIAILGWGSLIWDPRDLPREGPWQNGGPILPVEFSRVSRDGRLTLVIEPDFGAPVCTRFVLSPRSMVDDVRDDLARREGATKDKIGFVDLTRKRNSAADAPRQATFCATIQEWCQERRLQGAVWTALGGNFEQETDKIFSVPNAIAYLKGLPKSARSVALHYIESAPEEVATPVRAAFLAESARDYPWR